MSFGSQPTGAPLFGQTTGFGAAQQPFGAAPAAATQPFGASAAPPAFGTTFGTGGSALQFGASATPLFGQTAQPPAFSLGTTSTPGSTFGTTNLFGAASSAPSTGLTFGAPASTAPAFGTGLGFGTSATPATGFGMPASSAPASTFGLSSTFATPASTQSTGLTFGMSSALPSSGLKFNTPASSGLSFGTTAAAPSTSISFGSTVPNTGITFATPATASSVPAANTGLSFGTPAAGAATFGATTPFMLATTTQNSGLALGATKPTPNISLGMGNLGTTSASSGLTFATPAATTLSFMTQTAPASSSLTTATVPTTSITFGTSTSASLSLGAKTTGGITFGTPTLSLGAGMVPTSSTAPLTFNQSFTSTSNATTASPFIGLGATTITTAAAAPLGLGGILTNKSGTAQTGLGGISTATPKQTVTSTTTPQSELPPKDQPLPNELLQTVEAFKAFLKEQKANSSEIARFSVKELKTVETNITGVNNTINEIENELQKNKCNAEKLKLDSAQALHYAEMAQRTFDIPPGMQYENTAPLQFFVQLLQNFERDLQHLRFHLEGISKQVKNGNSAGPLTPEDLALGLRRLHQTFVTLAGRLQIVHNQVEAQKEQYLSLRRDVLNDTSNIFETQNKDLESIEYTLKSIANENKLPDVMAGPSPFNSLGTGQAQLLAQNSSPAYPGLPLGHTGIATNQSSSLFGKSFFGSALGDSSSLFNSPQSNSFQLQKPPTGSKRGKT